MCLEPQSRSLLLFGSWTWLWTVIPSFHGYWNQLTVIVYRLKWVEWKFYAALTLFQSYCAFLYQILLTEMPVLNSTSVHMYWHYMSEWDIIVLERDFYLVNKLCKISDTQITSFLFWKLCKWKKTNVATHQMPVHHFPVLLRLICVLETFFKHNQTQHFID